VASASRVVQWSALTEENKRINELMIKRFRFMKTVITIKRIRRGQSLAVLHLHISVALEQKTANFKVTIDRR
jgi:hypothetical protein